MAIKLPEPGWPAEMLEAGPPEDPTILLAAPVDIGATMHRLLAIRIDPDTLMVDFRESVGEDIYEPYDLDLMLDDLEFFDDIDAAGLVTLASGSYVIWMVPYPEGQD
jgi:hypothetical protein